ncbi:MAG: TolC family protein [Candidatus Limimorpha sp.]
MRLVSLIILLLISILLHSQKVWTLDECIEYAMEHNVEIMQSLMMESDAEYRNKMAKNAWLPTVSAEASTGFGFGQSPSSTGLYVPNNSSTLSFGMSVNMPVFNGLRLYHEQKSSDLELRAAMKDVEAAKYSLEMLVMSCYMQVIYNKEIKAIAEKQLSITELQYENTRQLFDLGRVAESDVYECSAQVAIAKSTLVEADNALMLSVLELCQCLELEDVAGFDVVSPEDFAIIVPNSLPSQESTYNTAVINQPVMQAANLRLEKSYSDVKTMKSAWLPSLGFFAGYSNGYYNYFNSNILNDKWSEQIRANGRTQIGLSLSIPVFNGFKTKTQVKISELSIKNQEYAIDKAEKSLKKEIQQAFYNAVAAEQKYLASKESFEAAGIAYKYSSESFQAGKTTLFELNESKNRLFKSESEMMQAKYDYLYRIKILELYNR